MVETARVAPVTPIERRDRLRGRLSAEAFDHLVVTAVPDLRYLTGFTGCAGALAIGADGRDHFVTDFRYETQIADEIDPEIDVSIVSGVALLALGEILVARSAKRSAFDPTRMTLADAAAWDEAVGLERVSVAGWTSVLRSVKSEGELEILRRAAAVADRTLSEVVPQIQPGIRERDLAAEIDHRMVNLGAERPSFETIVAFGPRSALPHASPGASELTRGQLVLIDFGAVVDGYASDMTRTFACGDPGAELTEIYRIVAEAQARALAGLGAGMTGREADALARDPIEAAGYGDHFGHSLGHGVGLEVHEKPKLSRVSEDLLTPGMVVTVEPGIYIAGSGGVRIEDDVVLLEEGVELLTEAPRESLVVL